MRWRSLRWGLINNSTCFVLFSVVSLSSLIGEMRVRSVNVKKTKSSKKIVLKITMSMTERYNQLMQQHHDGREGGVSKGS